MHGTNIKLTLECLSHQNRPRPLRSTFFHVGLMVVMAPIGHILIRVRRFASAKTALIVEDTHIIYLKKSLYRSGQALKAPGG
jgi:hypothetical protein